MASRTNRFAHREGKIPARWLIGGVAAALLMGTFLFLIPLLPEARAQVPEPAATMPVGWESLGASDFLDAVEALYADDNPPTAEHQREVIAHGWDTFLLDANFVANGDWATIQRAVRLLAPRRGILPGGGTPAEVEAAQQQVDDNWATLGTRLSARVASDPTILTGKEYGQVGGVVDTLAQGGATGDDQAQVYIQWMDDNDWESLSSFNQRTQLMEKLGADQVVFDRMSARWTGSILAPASGQYTIRQDRQHLGDPVIKVWIDDQLVLDSTPPNDGTYVGTQFVSQPVQLSAQSLQSIRVEMVHDQSDSATRVDYSASCPSNALTWESASLEQQLIPATALEPPDGFAPAGAVGLKGEYFSDMEFESLAATRLDLGLNMIWTKGPVVPRYDAEFQLVREACEDKVMDAGFLSVQTGFAQGELAQQDLRRLAAQMTLDERAVLAVELTDQTELLTRLDGPAMGELIKSLYMLPGKEHLDLLQAWSEACPQPRTQLGKLVGYGEWEYYAPANFGRYWQLGRYFVGPYAEDVDLFLADHLEMPDGACNLGLAYPIAFAARDTGRADAYRARVQQALDNEQIQGDARMTWLLAQAYASEVFISGGSRLGQDMESLRSALVTAQNPEARFWALQELVARHASLGRAAKTEDLVTQYSGEFGSEEQQATMQMWQDRANEWAALYEHERQENVQRQAQMNHRLYVAELERRLAAAQDHGDQQDISRYQQLLEAASAP